LQHVKLCLAEKARAGRQALAAAGLAENAGLERLKQALRAQLALSKVALP